MAKYVERFITTAGFVEDAIKLVTNSLIGHVELQTPEGTWIGAHSDHGVQEMPEDYCTPIWERRYAIECSDEDLAKRIAFTRSKVGIKYDFADIGGLFFHNRDLNTDNRFICSAFAFEVVRSTGHNRLNVLDGFAYLVTPETYHLSPDFIGKGLVDFNKG